MTVSPERSSASPLAMHTSRALTVVAAAALMVAFAFSGSMAQTKPDANTVLAKGAGIEIKQADLDLAEEELGQQLQGVDDATKRDQLVSYLIDMKLVAKAAEDKKLGDNDDFKRRIAFARERMLMDRYLATESKAAVTDAEMRKIYDDAAKQITSDQEVHARHILVETEDEAKAIIADLKKGGDFAAIAKAKSKDPGGAEGGDLGFFTKDQMVPEFSEVGFQARTRHAVGPGQVAVRLARHQGRGKARTQGAGIRPGEAADRAICDATRPGRTRQQAARRAPRSSAWTRRPKRPAAPGRAGRPAACEEIILLH